MSFDVMRSRPEVTTCSLRSDWSKEEAVFRAGIEEFRASIAIANAPIANPPYTYSSEANNPVLENLPPKEVPKEPEINPKLLKDDRTESVESINVRVPYVGLDIATSATVRQESVVNIPSNDPFDDAVEIPKTSKNDDLFDFADVSKKTPVAEQKPAPRKAETQSIDPFDDFVVPQNSSPTPAAIPIVPQPVLVETIAKSVTTPAAEPAQPAKLASVPPSAAMAEHSKSKKPSESLKPHGETKSAAEAMEGFDAERFEHVKATAAEMLDGCPNVDLDQLLNELGDYSVDLDIDYLRENPHILTDKLLEVQAKRDSLHAQILRLTPLVVSMRHASEYFNTVGIACSTASSREKRLAQVNFIISDFLVRLSKVDRTNTNVEHCFKHLADQYELCSRLITGYQIKTKIGEIARGEVPFDPPYKTVPAAGKIQVIQEAAKPTLAAKATGTPPRDEVEDKLLSRELSQPVSSNGTKKFESLESFDSGSKPFRKTTVPAAVTGTTESEW